MSGKEEDSYLLCSHYVLIAARHSQLTEPSQPGKVVTIILPLLQMRKWRRRRMNALAQGHSTDSGPI